MKENTDLVNDFREGDYLFGLEVEARAECYGDVHTRLVNFKAKNTFITIDEVNQRLGPMFFNKKYSMSPLRECNTPVKDHAAFLLSESAYHPKTPENLCDSKQKLRYKQLRSCLAAIAHCKGSIRFCLDGLDMEKVRNPDYLKEYNSYTSNELRYIAINFDTLSEKVAFYLRGERVDTPWEDEGLSPADWLKNYGIEPKKLSSSEFQYATPKASKRSRADVIRELFLPTENTQKPEKKALKFEDETPDNNLSIALTI